MKKITTLLLALPIVLFTACGNDEPEEENIDIEKNPLGALMQMSENLEEQAEKMEEQLEKMEERKDAKAIDYEKLIELLPTSIDGYTADEPSGENIEMTGMSYASAEVSFKDEENNKIHVTILDYNAAMPMFTMATAMWSSGLKINTTEELAQSIKFNKEISGWETLNKKNGDASLILGIGSRFLVTIEGDKQEDCKNLKAIAKDMDLDGLVNMGE
jgi:hypothetical protein